MCKIAQILVAIVLAIIGYKDWRSKKISYLMLATLATVTIIFRFTVMEDSLWNTIGGVAIGGLFFVISKCTGEAVGYGDSWIILFLGLFVGGKTVLEIVLLAVFLVALFALLFCMKKGWKKTYTVPFVPFLIIAYLGVVFF